MFIKTKVTYYEYKAIRKYWTREAGNYQIAGLVIVNDDGELVRVAPLDGAYIFVVPKQWYDMARDSGVSLSKLQEAAKDVDVYIDMTYSPTNHNMGGYINMSEDNKVHTISPVGDMIIAEMNWIPGEDTEPDIDKQVLGTHYGEFSDFWDDISKEIFSKE